MTGKDTVDQVAKCNCRMDDHCYFEPKEERRYNFCDNAIDAKCCPRGFR